MLHLARDREQQRSTLEGIVPRDPIDDFLDGLKQAVTEFATDFVQDRIHGALPPQPRARRVSANKPPKVKKPKAERPAKREPQGSNLYDELEVSSRASAETIRAAYLSLSKRYHPDVAKFPNAAARMKLINAAWEVLGDKEKRKVYDAKLREAR